MKYKIMKSTLVYPSYQLFLENYKKGMCVTSPDSETESLGVADSKEDALIRINFYNNYIYDLENKVIATEYYLMRIAGLYYKITPCWVKDFSEDFEKYIDVYYSSEKYSDGKPGDAYKIVMYDGRCPVKELKDYVPGKYHSGFQKKEGQVLPLVYYNGELEKLCNEYKVLSGGEIEITEFVKETFYSDYMLNFLKEDSYEICRNYRHTGFRDLAENICKAYRQEENFFKGGFRECQI